jgi:hypothetical protein
MTPATRIITPANITQPKPRSSSATLASRTVPGSLLICLLPSACQEAAGVIDEQMLHHALRTSFARIG